MTEHNTRAIPRVFLCHGSEDKPLARRIASDLLTAAIETFFDEWEIRAGDSIRQKIDAGLKGCTHFIVLLSPTSVQRPWVNAEMDAGFVRKISGEARFIALRTGLEIAALPPLLQGLYSPAITAADYRIKELIGDIYEINIKPPLGSAQPPGNRAIAQQTGLSPAAAAVAELFVRRSVVGRANDPKLSVTDLKEGTGLTDAQLIDAVDELEELGMAKPARVIGLPPFGYREVRAGAPLFEALDGLIMGWNTEQDALVVAAVIASAERRGHATRNVMNELGWTPRRMNPALKYLIDRDLVMASDNLDPVFVSAHFFPTPKTRRFVRQHSIE
jgi:MTH538 TIR-like domain (DUF1863).